MSTILRVAARGDGVAADGRHAANAAPGDTLTEAGEVVPGPHHQAAPCRHFPRCGGCRLQHLDEGAYATFVADRVRSALAGQGLEADVRPPAVSPPRTRRRATLHAGGGRLGFAEAQGHAIVDLLECHILAPELWALVAPLRRLLSRLRHRRADVGMTLVDGGVDLVLSGVEADGLAATEALTAFAQEHGLARLSLDDGFGPAARWEPEPATVTLAGVPVPFPAGAFLQATREGEGALVAAVTEAVAGASTIADLFAGLGTFALALPGRIYAAEAAQAPILSFKAAAARAGRTVFADHRDLYRRPLQAAELDRFDAVVLDPPRAGAREQVVLLAESRVPVIAYASCNPATFARDAAALVACGYRLEWVRPIGQFRWSTHVELVARLSRQ
jgi:23S rRNA (uracil1939-C5)-methyltransferase